MFTRLTDRILLTSTKFMMATGNNTRGFASAGLSPETIKIVKATAPVLAQHGYQITRTMYKKMLGGNEEVRSLFNPTHQLELGGKKARQPWTLASAVHAYAENIDNLGALSEAVERIAQKHVSLYVLPEHYPVVGENLLWAIKEVLGDAATPQIMDAWKEAYLFLADIFVQRERQIREGKAHEKGGWEGWRKFVVDQKVKESDEITSFYLKPKDNGPLPTFYPGQYTAVRMELPVMTTQRNYSLSIAPGRPHLRITVKKEQPMHPGCPVGHISNHLHSNVKEGDELMLGVPCGDFYLKVDHNKPIVLLSGGVGITPIMSMLEYLVDNKAKNQVEVITAARNPQVEAMHEVFAKHAGENPNIRVMTLYDSDPSGFAKGPVNQALLDQLITNKDAHYYFCGPEGFMRTVYKTLLDWKIPANQIHYEFFGPHDDLLTE